MDCEHLPETVRIIIRNGDSQIFDRCEICHERLTTNHRHELYDMERVPVVEDWSLSVPPCRRCGARGVEAHHWAPRALFGEEADLWPIDYLCRPCHVRWHQTMDGHRSVA